MSQRDRLLARSRPSAEYRIRVEDITEPLATVEAAEAELRLVRYRQGEDSEAAQEAQATVEQARTALGSCFETLKITALPPADMEALIAAHPPTQQQREAGEVWNIDTLRPVLLAECIEGDMTQQDWAELTTKGPMSVGEVRDLWATVLVVNDRTMDSRIPKG